MSLHRFGSHVYTNAYCSLRASLLMVCRDAAGSWNLRSLWALTSRCCFCTGPKPCAGASTLYIGSAGHAYPRITLEKRILACLSISPQIVEQHLQQQFLIKTNKRYKQRHELTSRYVQCHDGTPCWEGPCTTGAKWVH